MTRPAWMKQGRKANKDYARAYVDRTGRIRCGVCGEPLDSLVPGGTGRCTGCGRYVELPKEAEVR